jgi:hypothetical protein
MGLERPQLVRQSRLGQMNPIGGSRNGTGFRQRNQRTKVPDFQHDVSAKPEL